MAPADTQLNGFINGLRSQPPSRSSTRHASDRWVIQKFGGTSVGKFPDKIAEEIVGLHLNDSRVAIVCSARSTDTKEEGTTTRLMLAAESAMQPGSSKYLNIISAIRDDHIAATEQYVSDASRQKDLIASIEAECSKVAKLLGAAQIIDEISPKTLDSIIGTGEKLACMFMAAVLADRGLEAEYVNLETLLSNGRQFEHGLTQPFYDNLAKLLGERVRAVEPGKIPVITGYFGVVPGSLLTSVGRGYTDLCAAMVAVGLDADELQVWKEVDGIFTADPRKVPTARLIKSITPDEAAELTYFGSEVIHPFTMEQAIRARIPIRIKNVMRPAGEGTIVFPDSISRKGEETPTQPPRHVRMLSEDNLLQLKSKRPTAITVKNQILVLNIHSNRKSLSHDFFARVFKVLDTHKLVIDLISTSEVHVSMALSSGVRAQTLVEVVKELQQFGSVDIIKHMCILSLVGKQMKNMVGIAGRMFQTLAEFNINIEMISQGASEINISCVIEEKDAVRAMNVLHTKLFTYQDVPDFSF